MWKSEEKAKEVVANNAVKTQSIIGQNSIIVGEIKGRENLIIEGSFDGSINLGSNTVTVGKTGMLKGTIKAKTIIVEGKIDGDLTATERVLLKKTAKVKGNVITTGLVMDDGCFFCGKTDMVVESAKTISPKSNRPNGAVNSERKVVGNKV